MESRQHQLIFAGILTFVVAFLYALNISTYSKLPASPSVEKLSGSIPNETPLEKWDEELYERQMVNLPGLK
jgi:hypothetical protein